MSDVTAPPPPSETAPSVETPFQRFCVRIPRKQRSPTVALVVPSAMIVILAVLAPWITPQRPV